MVQLEFDVVHNFQQITLCKLIWLSVQFVQFLQHFQNRLAQYYHLCRACQIMLRWQSFAGVCWKRNSLPQSLNKISPYWVNVDSKKVLSYLSQVEKQQLVGLRSAVFLDKAVSLRAADIGESMIRNVTSRRAQSNTIRDNRSPQGQHAMFNRAAPGVIERGKLCMIAMETGRQLAKETGCKWHINKNCSILWKIPIYTKILK